MEGGRRGLRGEQFTSSIAETRTWQRPMLNGTELQQVRPLFVWSECSFLQAGRVASNHKPWKISYWQLGPAAILLRGRFDEAVH